MTLGIIAGLGMSATAYYKYHLSPRAPVLFHEIDTEKFLASSEPDRIAAINAAAFDLRDRGATAGTIACFTYRDVGRAAIEAAGLRVAPWLKEPDPTWADGYTIVATSQALRAFRHVLPVPPTALQARVDELIWKFALNPQCPEITAQGELFAQLKNPLICCTDLNQHRYPSLQRIHVVELTLFLHHQHAKSLGHKFHEH